MSGCFSLLLVCICTTIHLPMASSERFFVVTKANNPCPGKFTGEPCLTITQFVSGSYTRFLSDPSLVSGIILDLQPGLHRITNSYNLHVQNIATFAIQATTGGAILDCGNGEFNISNVKNVQVSGIEFINCRKNIVIQLASHLMFDNCSLSQHEGLWITDTNKAVITKCSFMDGKKTVYIRKTSVKITECTFTNNCVGIFGDGSYITIVESIFTMNSADCVLDSSLLVRTGAAIHMKYNAAIERRGHLRDKALTIINSSFYGNTARENGGAIYVYGTNIIANGSTFINNTARLQGGAVYIASTSTSTESTSNIYNSEFISNHASIGGGAIYAPGSVQITKSAFIANTARLRGGGAVYTGGHHSNIEVTKSVFRNNSAAYCGAFDIDELHHSVTFSESIFVQNTATGGSDIGDILNFSGIKSDIGGVICVRNASVSIIASNFTRNKAAGYGGVMYVDDSTITVEKSIFDGNVAGYSGGVIFTELHRIHLMITLSSFVNNQAKGGDGGVMYIGRAYSQVSISESNFGFNGATERGGVIIIYGGVLDMNATDFYNNTAIFGGEIGSACNSKETIPDILTSVDPEFSFCNLYEERQRQYDRLTTMAATTSIPLPTTAEYKATTADASPVSPSKTTVAETTNSAALSTFTTTTITDSPTATSIVAFTTNSPPTMYFELNGSMYLNNSMIALQNVGEGKNALACITNQQNCCSTLPHRKGEFYYPNGEQVPIFSRGDNFYRRRGDGEIYLNRRFGITSPTGTYSCVIPDATESFQTLYIDLL